MDQSPEEQGYNAYCAGIMIRENPYPDGTIDARDWGLGWFKAWDFGWSRVLNYENL